MNATRPLDFDGVVDFASRRPGFFRRDFLPWLAANLHVWNRFESEANKLYARGRRHYSARTIIHYIRHETALQEVSDDGWKINDHVSPDLARLWLLIYPEREGFFELRTNEERAA